MAGQEGFEPPASGFGDRRSAVGATALHGRQGTSPGGSFILPGFAMQGMLAVPGTIFLYLQPARSVLFVLAGAVVAALALGAGEQDIDSFVACHDLFQYLGYDT